MKFSLSTVKKMTDFLKAYKPSDYEVFDGRCGDILLKIYTCGDIEIYISSKGYEVVFSDYTDYENLKLNELIEVLDKWCNKWNSSRSSSQEKI